MHAYVCIYLCVFLTRHVIACYTCYCVNLNIYLEGHLLSFYIAMILLTIAMAENILSPLSPTSFISQPMGLYVGMIPCVATGRQTPSFGIEEKIGNSQRRLSYKVPILSGH